MRQRDAFDLCFAGAFPAALIAARLQASGALPILELARDSSDGVRRAHVLFRDPAGTLAA
jgi:hypothetical protein